MARLHFTIGEKHTTAELGPLTTIGRRPHNTIQLADRVLSASHCVIELCGDVYVLRDTHSSSGTYVNDKRITEHALCNGDEIVLGHVRARFEVGTAAMKPEAWLADGLAYLQDRTNPEPDFTNEHARVTGVLHQTLNTWAIAKEIRPPAGDQLRTLIDELKRIGLPVPRPDGYTRELLDLAERALASFDALHARE